MSRYHFAAPTPAHPLTPAQQAKLRAWAAVLPQYQQATGALRTPDGYCCLGCLTEWQQLGHPVEQVQHMWRYEFGSGCRSTTIVPRVEFQVWFECDYALAGRVLALLTHANDCYCDGKFTAVLAALALFERDGVPSHGNLQCS